MGKEKYLLSPLVNLMLFDILLVATPFLMLQNYLQLTVKSLSRVVVDVLGFSVPIVLLLAIFFVLIVLFFSFRKLNLFRVGVILFVVLMMVAGQKVADYFLNNKFYDLQHNWHYFAYGLFVFVMHRYLLTKKISDSKIIMAIYSKAFIISAFDEGIQVFISNRIFDISDIAKDMWGVTMGLILLFFILRNAQLIENGWRFTHKKIKDYFSSPLSLLLLLVMLNYILLFVSSILTEDEYWWVIVLWTVVLFLLLFFIVHFCGFRKIRVALIVIFFGLVIVQVSRYFTLMDKDITSCSEGLIVYKGIPLIYFDFMIYPDGMVRAVDKKKWYRGGDFTTFFNQGADIILVGRGFDELGGQGFLGTQFYDYPYFIFNTVTGKNVQVILLDTPTACREYNRLVKERKKVLFVIHNS